MTSIKDALNDNGAGRNIFVKSWFAELDVWLDGKPVAYPATDVLVSLSRLLVSAEGGLGTGFTYPHELKENEKNTFDLMRSNFFAYAEFNKRYDESPEGTVTVTLVIEQFSDGREQATVEGVIEGGKVSKGASDLKVSGKYGFVVIG